MRRSGCQPFRSYSSKNGICLNCEGRSARQQQLIVKDARRPPRRVTLTVPTCKPLVAYDHLYLAQTPADPPELLRFGFHEKVSRKRTGSNFTIVALRASPAPTGKLSPYILPPRRDPQPAIMRRYTKALWTQHKSWKHWTRRFSASNAQRNCSVGDRSQVCGRRAASAPWAHRHGHGWQPLNGHGEAGKNRQAIELP